MSYLSKTVANRKNSKKSTGPRNTVSTRYNALKHGFLAEGVTELDDRPAFEQLRARLENDFAPNGEMERFLVERIALGMLRLTRSALMEAEFITGILNPAKTRREGGLDNYGSDAYFDGILVVEDPGLPARISAEAVDSLNAKFMRYDANAENRIFRALHELERLRRSRRGDAVPPPSAVDVTVHAPESVASFGNVPDRPAD